MKKTLNTAFKSAAQYVATHKIVWLAAAVVFLLELVVFNLPWWTTANMPAAQRTFGISELHTGPGLRFTPLDTNLSGKSTTDSELAEERDEYIEKAAEASGKVLQVIDPATAYVDIPADSGVPVTRISIESGTVNNLPVETGEALVQNMHVRIDVQNEDGQWHTGESDGFCPQVISSANLHVRTSADKAKTVRVYFLETFEKRFALNNITLNSRPNFHFIWLRFAVLSLIATALIALRPRSVLYKIKLDITSKKQRLAWWICWTAPWICVVIYTGTWLRWPQNPSFFHWPNSYAYDFTQYQHAADSILHGVPWLDLQVPPEYAALDNPYSITARNELLAKNTYPIYWDHAYFNGHWYCYFGVVPTVLFFVPYQAITGIWLSNAMAINIALAGTMIFGSLAIFHALERFFPRISAGHTILILFGFFAGANITAMIVRLDFYIIPAITGLCMLAIAFWLFLGSMKTKDAETGKMRIRHCDDSYENTVISWKKIAVGSSAMALTLGCRPPLFLGSVLLIPTLIDICKVLRARNSSLNAKNNISATTDTAAASTAKESTAAANKSAEKSSAAPGTESAQKPGFLTKINIFKGLTRKDLTKLCSACILPALCAFIPILAYNRWRFGSWLNFGEKYQVTIIDMTSYHMPLQSWPKILAYYLFLPFDFCSHFPFISSPFTPVEPWQFTECVIAGLFFLAPILWIIFLLPFAAKRLKAHKALNRTILAVSLAVFVMLAVSCSAGLSWRYMADFAWIFMVAAMYVMAAVAEWSVSAPEKSAGNAESKKKTEKIYAYAGKTLATANTASTRHYISILVLEIVVLSGLAISVACIFVTDRTYAMIDQIPYIYYVAKSWFPGI